MIINPALVFAVFSIILVLAIVVVARLAYSYGCRQADAAERWLSCHDIDPDGRITEEQGVIPADSAEWDETKAEIISSLQGRITVNVIAQQNQMKLP